MRRRQSSWFTGKLDKGPRNEERRKSDVLMANSSDLFLLASKTFCQALAVSILDGGKCSGSSIAQGRGL